MMGYGYYELPTPGGRIIKRGYSVACKCHQRGCGQRIDRGLAYLCYHCTQYYCYDHLTVAESKVDCFAGESSQVCVRCAAELAKATEGEEK